MQTVYVDKNKELSVELKKLTDKLSEVKLQLQDKRQQHELQKQKDVKTCQKVRHHFQTCGITDAKRVNILFSSTCSDELYHLIGVILMRHLQMEDFIGICNIPRYLCNCN